MFSIRYFITAAAPFLARSVLAAPATELVERTGTEVVTCYNIGTTSNYAPIVTAVNQFCAAVTGQTFSNGRSVTLVYPGDVDPVGIYVSAKVINGCSFVVDNNCSRLLMLSVDGCNTAGQNGKQGGYETDACGVWGVDPGNWYTGNAY